MTIYIITPVASASPTTRRAGPVLWYLTHVRWYLEAVPPGPQLKGAPRSGHCVAVNIDLNFGQLKEHLDLVKSHKLKTMT